MQDQAELALPQASRKPPPMLDGAEREGVFSEGPRGLLPKTQTQGARDLLLLLRFPRENGPENRASGLCCWENPPRPPLLHKAPDGLSRDIPEQPAGTPGTDWEGAGAPLQRRAAKSRPDLITGIPEAQ